MSSVTRRWFLAALTCVAATAWADKDPDDKPFAEARILLQEGGSESSILSMPALSAAIPAEQDAPSSRPRWPMVAAIGLGALGAQVVEECRDPHVSPPAPVPRCRRRRSRAPGRPAPDPMEAAIRLVTCRFDTRSWPWPVPGTASR